MAAEADEILIRPLDEQRQLQNRLDTNRPSHGRTWVSLNDAPNPRSYRLITTIPPQHFKAPLYNLYAV
jgi:hypothetical protein